jgi:hypothetical protein
VPFTDNLMLLFAADWRNENTSIKSVKVAGIEVKSIVAAPPEPTVTVLPIWINVLAIMPP